MPWAIVTVLLTAAADPVPESAPAPAPTPDLASCAAIAEPGARLACYDALTGRAAEAPSAGDFGLPRAQETPEEAPSLSAHIAGPFKEWKKGTRVTLDNGQVWKVMTDSHGYDSTMPDNAEVTITRGFLGAYWMKIHGTNRTLKVKRVQ